MFKKAIQTLLFFLPMGVGRGWAGGQFGATTRERNKQKQRGAKFAYATLVGTDNNVATKLPLLSFLALHTFPLPCIALLSRSPASHYYPAPLRALLDAQNAVCGGGVAPSYPYPNTLHMRLYASLRGCGTVYASLRIVAHHCPP